VIVLDGDGVAVYVIFLFGCHGVTVLQVELTPTEAALVRELSRMSRMESSSGRQPRLSIVKVEQRFEIDKVVSIDEQNPSTPLGDRARPRPARDEGGGPTGRPGRLGGGADRLR
jgi:hypothetical protein